MKILYGLTREAPGPHPSTDLVPQAAQRYKPSLPADIDGYDGLTDESPWMHYAWAFLRRNRLFQANEDNPNDLDWLDVNWGYRSFPGSAGSTMFTGDKSYTENALTGTVLHSDQWESLPQEFAWALDTDEESDEADDPIGAREITISSPHRLSRAHLVLLLRADEAFGPGIDAIEEQVDYVRRLLQLQRERLGTLEAIKGVEKLDPTFALHKLTKRTLRECLVVTDLWTPDKSEGNDAPSVSSLSATYGTMLFPGNIDEETRKNKLRLLTKLSFNLTYKFGYLALLRKELGTQMQPGKNNLAQPPAP